MSNTFDNDPGEESTTPVRDRLDAPSVVSDPDPRESGPSSWRAFRDPLLLSILVIALVADQLTKQLVLNNLGLGTSWLDNGIFDFTYVRNDGTAFGLFQDNGTLLTFVSMGAVALIVYFYREAAMASWFTRVALGLQLGGAAGNLIDRFRHGYVVDFIDVGPWPIFNIADSAIVTGIVALIAYFILFGEREQKASQAFREHAGAENEVPDPAIPPGSPPENRS
ncbi:MAG: signal peptidase II [Dehalococcoidia bacterium]|jgi:signal peptidase II|nr:signal peptidase II [Dehalococcoidia bacterium]